MSRDPTFPNPKIMRGEKPSAGKPQPPRRRESPTERENKRENEKTQKPSYPRLATPYYSPHSHLPPHGVEERSPSNEREKDSGSNKKSNQKERIHMISIKKPEGWYTLLTKRKRDGE